VEKVPELPTGAALERLLGACCPDAVVVADRDGVIRHWNAAAERLFGHAADDVLGRSLDVIVPERLRTRHWAGWHEVVRTGATRYGDEVLKVPSQHADGRPLSLEFRVVLVRDADGAVAGVAAFLRDVTATWQELRTLRARVAALERDRG
jgi:PAS domain S-box-containing protein